MQNANMIMSIFVFYGQKKGIPSENPFLFRKELNIIFSFSIDDSSQILREGIHGYLRQLHLCFSHI